MKDTPTNLGADQCRWRLDRLYAGLDDPQLNSDLEQLEAAAVAFDADYRGRLTERLSDAIIAYEKIEALAATTFSYLFLYSSLDLGNQAALSRKTDAENRWQTTAARHLTFFELELCSLDEAVITRWCAPTTPAARFLPWVKLVRRHRPHQLSEPVEQALASRASFGPNSWHGFYEEIEAELRFDFAGHRLTQSEILHVISDDPDEDNRAAALAVFHAGLGGTFHRLAAQALYVTAGAKAVDDEQRGFPTPLAARNLGNQVDDQVVEALHAAVRDAGATYARRFYRLKARLLNIDTLRWSDRNAPLPLTPTATVPFSEAAHMVEQALNNFSPTMGALVRQMLADGSIDAPASPGKSSGAFNASFVTPNGDTHAYTLLNYQGSARDVMTLAHELGHGIHGLLSGIAQGPLIYHAPMAYCETASVFAEMLTFQSLLNQLETIGDVRGRLALLAHKLDDIVNTVVRQISFSDFERGVHEAKRRLAPEECDRLWLEVTQRYYGADGEIFTYENADRLWSYVSHFHRPFYVYSYAFGELLTHSLMACREKMGPDFEPAYLELLRAGGTKNAVELLTPFGLDPREPEFWRRGLDLSLGRLLDQAEALADDLH